MNELREELEETRTAITKVEGKIQHVETNLSHQGLPQDDRDYFRKEKEQLQAELLLLRQTRLELAKCAAQQYLSPPKTPMAQRRRQEDYVQPSAGKAPAAPATVHYAPSSPSGQEEALRHVGTEPSDEHELFCSSNSFALRLVKGFVEQDQPNQDDKYRAAAQAFLLRKEFFVNGGVKKIMGEDNERFLTGSFCDALNSVLPEGYTVLHQACLGKGTTHSDISGRYSLSSSSRTLLVGEGKKGGSQNIRIDCRGQLFNELIRHRKLDRASSRNKDNYVPILLLAFDAEFCSVELAFPSTKGGAMEKCKWVMFNQEIDKGTETFWTVRLAYVMLHNVDVTASTLRLIANGMVAIGDLPGDYGRAQYKTPWLEPPPYDIFRAAKRGDNVTIVETKRGEKHVYKEFCYYLRQQDELNHVNYAQVIEKKNQRTPPADTVLDALGSLDGWYSEWKVEKVVPDCVQILSYPYIEGSCTPGCVEAWEDLLHKISVLHGLGYAHADLLPRNLVFTDQKGYIIDFDMMRKHNEGCYVAGFNARHETLARYRHKGALPEQKVNIEHDLFALKVMTLEFFDCDENIQQRITHAVSVKGLKAALSSGGGSITTSSVTEQDDSASGSPQHNNLAESFARLTTG